MTESNKEHNIVIQKSDPLYGEVEISGSKNSILKLMVATILAEGSFKLKNVPHIGDVEIMIELLRSMGSQVKWSKKNKSAENEAENELAITTPVELNPVVTYELVEKMRASVLVLAPLLVRFQEAEVALPGGDNLGPRPVDMLLMVLESLGAKTQVEHGYIKASAKNLIGTELALDIPSVGATETAMMAAVGAKGVTIIENAAREPEVIDLANFLNAMCKNTSKDRHNITGQGTSTITIQGCEEITPAEHSVIFDRIEVATFIAALGITGGEIFLKGANPEHMSVLLSKFEEMGLRFVYDPNGIWVSFTPTKSDGTKNRLNPTDISSLPYPGVPTDALPLLVAMLSIADGVSVVTENLFDARFGYTDELIRIGAYIRTEGQHAIVRGTDQLSGSQVKALDIRAGAALVCAGLNATGETQITDVHHINRGYDDLIGKLQKIGANIELRT